MFNSFPKIRRDEPLSKYCWYALGGPADFFIEVENMDEIPPLIREAKKNNLPYFILGGGSNTVFHDEGFRGLVIKVIANHFEFEGEKIIADPGALTTQIAKESIEHGFTGIESLYGLPGTIGGAVFGNAEAHKTSIGDFVESVALYNPEKDEIHTEGKGYFEFSYRHSRLHETKEVILKVTLKLHTKSSGQPELEKKERRAKADQALTFRKEKQPSGRNNGSFFKNPQGDFAGRLIDAAGLKGAKIGGAYISEKHANFFMNDGNATTQNLIDLKALAQKTVKEKSGILLEPEVRIVLPDGTIS